MPILGTSSRLKSHRIRTHQSHPLHENGGIRTIQLHMQLAESTDNELVKKILKDIADEERAQAGEFMKRARTPG